MAGYRVSSAAAILGVALLVAACGSSSSTTKTSSAAPAATTPASTTPAASSLSIGAVKGSGGMYLTGASGRALYLWVADSGGKSSCTGACAKVWPPVVSSATPSAASGVNAADLSTITRPDGTKQVAYNGHPLYYYIADNSAGTTHGQGSNQFGAKWWLVGPSGSAITVSATKSTSSSGPYSSGSSSGGGSSTSSGGSGSSSGGWG
jgi:predicted lipoprotein with Yx(FWY)xxD motif